MKFYQAEVYNGCEVSGHKKTVGGPEYQGLENMSWVVYNFRKQFIVRRLE